MKNLITLFTLLLISTSFAQVRANEVFTWENDNKKLLNVYLKPQLNVSIEELNAGDNEFYATLTVKTNYSNITHEDVERMANGYQIRYVIPSMNSDELNLQFENGLSYSFNIMNTPNGPGIDSTIFINKKEFKKLDKNFNFQTNFSIYVNPLITTVIETKTLPASTCQSLGKKGNKLLNIASEYHKVHRRINSMIFRNSETKKRLFKELDKKCFKSLRFHSNNFFELMHTEVEIKQNNKPIKVELVKDTYKKTELNLEYSNE